MLIENLKFLLLNAENLFLMFDRPLLPADLELREGEWKNLGHSIYENKSLQKSKALGRIILEQNPDIVMLCEVGGNESLRNFNTYFLNNLYHCALVEGNSDRNIDVGYLVRKDLAFYFDLQSNKNRLINFLYSHEKQSLATGYPVRGQKNFTSHKFSRDVAELHLFTTDVNKPFLITLLTHLKSHRDQDNHDPEGFERRQAELKALVEIYNEIQARFPQTPILVCGDFNGRAGHEKTEPEFTDIYQKTDLEDVSFLSQKELMTHYQIYRNGNTDARQLDYAFLNKKAAEFLKPDRTFVYKYKDLRGIEQAPPQDLETKLSLPSDHYPVIFELGPFQL